MSFRRTFATIAAFLSAKGASRRKLLGREVVFVLVPPVVAIVLVLVYKGVVLLFPDVPATTNSTVFSGVAANWMLIAYSGFGISCECVGLSFFDKLDKLKRKFDLITALSVLVGLFSLLCIMMLFVLGVTYAVDLIQPGNRAFSRVVAGPTVVVS